MAPPKKVDKGKAVDRSGVQANERAPLLGEPSSSRSTASYATNPPPTEISPAPPRRSWNDLLIPAIILCSILLAACLFILLLAYSFVPSSAERDDLPSALTWRGPTRVDVVNITDDGIWLDVEGEYGVDLNRVFGIRRKGEVRAMVEEKGWRGAGAEWWEGLRAKVADRIVPMAGDVDVWIPAPIEVYPLNGHNVRSFQSPLLSASLPTAFTIDPTTLLHPSTASFPLHPISSLLHIQPLSEISHLLQFAQEGWQTGQVNVEVRVPIVRIEPSGGNMGFFEWKRVLRREKRDVFVPMRFELSQIPGLPPRNTKLLDLIKLRSYELATRNVSETNGTTVLGIRAIATAPNIVSQMRFDFPYRLGFEISLPVSEDAEEGLKEDKGETLFKMAEVYTLPLGLQGQDPVKVHIEGEIVGDLKAGTLSSEAGDTPLSVFLRNYLHGKDNIVTVRGSPEVTALQEEPAHKPPAWLISALPSISLQVPFPGPKNAPKLIRSVTIEDMRLSQASGKMAASGTVLAEIQLPKDFVGVKVQVVGVKPDVLVYDGPAPDGRDDTVPEEPPYPPKAFGRINPGYLDAESVISDDEPDILIVRAPLKNVPLEILAGRDAVLSDFVGKVIFKGGAMAGVKGIASVEVRVNGVSGVVELEGLGVQGEVKVGKPR